MSVRSDGISLQYITNAFANTTRSLLKSFSFSRYFYFLFNCSAG